MTKTQMQIQSHEKIRWIRGPAGYLSVHELPDPRKTRWVPRRKAEVVLAVSGGLLSAEEACRRYRMNPEELSAWQSAYLRYGIGGLKTIRPIRKS